MLQHTKHALEALHPDIKVFRHPDHHPSGYDVKAELETGFQNLSLRTFDLAKFSQDALKTLYGTSDDVVLYWAHHEKLCLVDGKTAFMGGLDMCAYSFNFGGLWYVTNCVSRFRTLGHEQYEIFSKPAKCTPD